MPDSLEVQIKQHEPNFQSWRCDDKENDFFAEVVLDLNHDTVEFAMPRQAFEFLLARAGFEKHDD